jgi:hypothetical protein
MSSAFAQPLEDIERKAIELDARLSPKTIYNELYRRPEFVRDDTGRWRLRRDSDGPPSELNLTNAPGERGKEEAPLTNN